MTGLGWVFVGDGGDDVSPATGFCISLRTRGDSRRTGLSDGRALEKKRVDISYLT